MTFDSSGNVGVGTTNPTSPLTVAGLIQSTSGGVKFPDNTIQTTAATGLPTGIVIGLGGGANNTNSFFHNELEWLECCSI